MTVTAKGLEGVVASDTRLSDVRAIEGQLIYCGYDINELAGKVSFEEIIFLLWNNRLPNRTELDFIKKELRAARQLPQGVIDFIQSAPKNAAPIDVMRTGISMLGLYDPGILDVGDTHRKHLRAISILAKIGIIVAYFHEARQGKPLPPIRDDLDEAAHFLYLMNGKTAGENTVRCLDTAYVLHADHGFNASTFAARVCVSTLTDMYSGVTTAIGTLKGPLHGGANEGVIHMLKEIGSIDKVDAWIADKLAKKEKIMGIGHRIYKTSDPRAPHLKAMSVQLTKEIGDTHWVEMSEKIAEIMLREKKLHANVDFYSATVYHTLGIPTDLFTPIFCIARAAGWTAHIMEQLGENRLFRPQSEYIGDPVGKKVVPIDQR
jgi:citrate synthase